jgi:hypothetical protein
MSFQRPSTLDGVPALLRFPLALLLATAGLAILYGLRRVWPYAPVVVALPLSPVLTPLFAPLAVELGFFRYHSRLLFSMPAWRGRAIHLGHGLDRLLHLRELGSRFSGRGVQMLLMASVVDGLISIAEDVDAKRLRADVRIQGTSHFFNERTVRSLGFEPSTATLADRVLFYLAWFEPFLWLSVLNGRLTLPHVPMTAHTTAGMLAHRLPRLRSLRDRLRQAEH